MVKFQTFRVIPCVIVVIVALALLIFYFGYHTTNVNIGGPDAGPALTYLSTNANLNPINLAFIDRTCPPTTVAATIGQFPGVTNAPDGSMETRDLTIWGKRYFVCLGRNINVRWLGPNEFCPSGYRQCSSNTCVASNENCPYIDLQVQQGNAPTASTRRLSKLVKRARRDRTLREAVNPGLKRLFPNIPSDQEVEPGANAFYDTAGNIQLLTFRRGSGSSSGNVVTDISVSIQGMPCITPNRYPARGFGKNYTGERVDRSADCGEFGRDGTDTNSPDDRFASLLDDQSEAKTYRANNIEVLPSFSSFLGEDQKARLITRRKIRAASIYDCQKVNAAQLKNINDGINATLNSYSDYYLALWILFAIALVLQILAFMLFQVKHSRWVIYVELVVLAIIGILMIFPTLSYNSNRDKYANDLATLQACRPEAPFDRVTGKINSDWDSAHSTATVQKDWFLTIGVIVLISSVVYLIILARSAIVARNKYDEEQKMKNSSPPRPYNELA
eukprot:TRINITY_DN2569_c0_g1_i1.p1 TRINITY_DN2569_c0_g1~~TRINITY_DN2569_c0_g1_i1.p1  ORF type:complete len:503 (-),score=96.10 TRINITY_DN2569_c0_g1_i1:104-1612(-)